MARTKATTSTGLTHDATRARLKSKGLRATPGRLATYALLYETALPLTHRQIADKLSDTGLDPATLFRNLQDLTEAGLVARTDLGDHVWRFELEGRHSGHPHFVCVDCGDVACLERVKLDARGAQVPRSMERRDVQVQVRGQCDVCAE